MSSPLSFIGGAALGPPASSICSAASLETFNPSKSSGGSLPGWLLSVRDDDSGASANKPNQDVRVCLRMCVI